MSEFANGSGHRMPDIMSLEVLAEELGAVAARIERESGLRVTALVSDIGRRLAEFELRFVAIERAAMDRTASVKDGERGFQGEPGEHGVPGERGERGVSGERGEKGLDGAAGERGEPGERGFQGDRGEKGLDGTGERGEPGERGFQGDCGARGEPGERGEKGLDGAAGERGEKGLDGAPGERGERGEPGAPGKLASVRVWSDKIHYDGDVVVHDGATYQALRDTGRSPPHDDWICLAQAGRDGADGASFKVCGTWNATNRYGALNVVVINGAAFVAKQDDPGLCPGEGWQLMASQGKQGKPGERGGTGPVGPRGEAGPSVSRMTVDDEGLLTLTNSDGSTITCDLYPVLTQLAR